MSNKNINDNSKKDKGLIGNEKIEEAIAALQEEPSQELLAHTLTVIRRRMQEDGQLILAVEPPAGEAQLRIQAVQTSDGKQWWSAFTGFEEELKVAFNDIDFCLKIREKGHLIVYDPYVELYHYESKTRGAEDTTEKIRRFQSEIEYMRSHWSSILKNGDPAYNPNLSLKKWDYSLRVN